MLPAADELRAALLAVLRAYISSFNSTNTSSLNLLMQLQQQQYQSEANWAGSVTGGPARSTKSARHHGWGGSVVSFAGSTSKQAAAAAATAAAAAMSSAGQATFLSASDVDGAGISGADSSMQRPAGSIVRGPASGPWPTVSFPGAVGPGDAADGWGAGADSGRVMGGSSNPGGRGVLMSKAGRAASVAASSEFRARGAGSVAGSRAAGSVGGNGRPGSAGAGPVNDCMSLHGALVLCKEVRG